MILRGYDQIRPKVIRLRSAVYTPKGVFEPMHASTWPAYRFPKALPGNAAEILDLIKMRISGEHG
jgi:hypothetical protein